MAFTTENEKRPQVQTDKIQIRRALLSVTDKTHLESLAALLTELNVELVASGGTFQYLVQNGFTVTPVEKITGNPELFAGRMKTLSFELFSGLLFKRDSEQDCQQAEQFGIDPIDLVVCNFYPFEQWEKKAQNGEISFSQLVEQVDIGGPSMVRAAAKNFASVAVLTDVSQYPKLMNELKEFGATTMNLRLALAAQAFQRTNEYETSISAAFNRQCQWDRMQLPPAIQQVLHPAAIKQCKELRYGENPQQKAWALSIKKDGHHPQLADVIPLQGKELSYNNYVDIQAAMDITGDLMSLVTGSNNQKQKFSAVIIKHANPCGVALSSDPLDALMSAWHSDSTSSFGSIIAFNTKVHGSMAQWLDDKFVEVIVAPDFSPEALDYFKRKKNLRLISLPVKNSKKEGVNFKSIDGGLLLQTDDVYTPCELQLVSRKNLSEEQKALAPFAEICAKHLKSNAIALVAKTQFGMSLVGGGMGNPNRLISVQQSVEKAQENLAQGHLIFSLTDAVLASDAFFPFSDNIELAYKMGIRAIIQPGGSIKDREVIETCDRLGLAMLFTHTRHFRH